MSQHRQLLRFTLFSSSAAVLQLVVFSVLFEGLAWRYWMAYLLSLLVLILWNTTFNRKYTFQSTVPYRVAISKLVGFYVIFIPVFTVLGDALTNHGWNEYLVLAITMLANLVLAFFYNKHVIYHA